MKEEMKKVQWIYAGRRQGVSDGKPLPVSIFYDDLDNKHVFGATKKGGPSSVGGVYEIEVSQDETSARISGARFLRMLKDEVQVAKFKLEHEAYEAEQKALSMERKGKSEALSALDPLRAVYAGLPFNQRLAFELIVLRYLRGAPR